MAFHDRSESTYSMLEAFTSGHRGEVRCHQDSKFFKEKFNRGTTFTIEGSMYDYVRVSCINPQNGEKVYWTWTRPLKFNESKIIDLRPLDVDSPFQMFYFNSFDLASSTSYEDTRYQLIDGEEEKMEGKKKKARQKKNGRGVRRRRRRNKQNHRNTETNNEKQ